MLNIKKQMNYTNGSGFRNPRGGAGNGSLGKTFKNKLRLNQISKEKMGAVLTQRQLQNSKVSDTDLFSKPASSPKIVPVFSQIEVPENFPEGQIYDQEAADQ